MAEKDPFADPFEEPAPAKPAGGAPKGAKGFGSKQPIAPPPDGRRAGGVPPGAGPAAFRSAETDMLPREAYAKAKAQAQNAKTGSLKHMGETAPIKSLENFGDTGEVKPLENYGDTGELKPLKHMGETGKLADPFTDDDPTRDEPPGGRQDASATHDEPRLDASDTRDESRAPFARRPRFEGEKEAEFVEPPSIGPIRRSDNEENVYVVLPDQPEPDSQPAFLNKGPRRAREGDEETVESSSADLANLEALRTPSYVKGGSEGLPLGGGEAHHRSAMDAPVVDDLRDIDAAPALEPEDTKDESYGKDETADDSQPGDADATAVLEPAAGQEEEPDFLYGERFQDKFQVPEGPPRKPSRLPQVLAGVGGLLLVAMMVAVIWKFASGPREFQGTEVPPVTKSTSGATSGISRPIPLPVPPKGTTGATTGGTSAAVDEPPPLPPPADAVEARIRRGLSWGLPIERPKAPGEGDAPTGSSPGAGGQR